jgi:hypothetical protein
VTLAREMVVTDASKLLGDTGRHALGAGDAVARSAASTLPHPVRHLRLVELVAFADVDLARVLALAGARRDRSQRHAAEEGHLNVVREGVESQDQPWPSMPYNGEFHFTALRTLGRSAR